VEIDTIEEMFQLLQSLKTKGKYADIEEIMKSLKEE
jgi:hypothetical protein